MSAPLPALGGHQPGHVEAVGHIGLHIAAQIRHEALEVEKFHLRHDLPQLLLRKLAVSVAVLLHDQLHGAKGRKLRVGGLTAASRGVQHGVAQQLIVLIQEQEAPPPVIPGQPVLEPVHLPAVLFHIGRGVLGPEVIGLGIPGQQCGPPAGVVAGEEILGAGVLDVLRGDVVGKGLLPLGFKCGELLLIEVREVVVAQRHLQLPLPVASGAPTAWPIRWKLLS